LRYTALGCVAILCFNYTVGFPSVSSSELAIRCRKSDSDITRGAANGSTKGKQYKHTKTHRNR
jgi:hypothetical protein